MQYTQKQILCRGLALFLVLGQFLPSFLLAQSEDELQSKIDESKGKIEKLQKEQAEYQSALTKIGSEKKTLQNTVYQLDTTKKKLDVDIEITVENISIIEDEIKDLGDKIDIKSTQIAEGKEAIATDLRLINELDDRSLIEVFLSGTSFSEMWNYGQQLKTISLTLRDKVNLLRQGLAELNQAKITAEQKNLELSEQRSLLSLQQESVKSQQQQKNSLLSQTKNQESEYQKILAKNQEEIAKEEAAMFEYERQLNANFNRDGYPKPQNGILSWPLSSIRITQMFGRTSDSGRLYASGTHNGMDFAASIGTTVKSVYGGVVLGTGNTDLQAGCYSFGKWVYVRHDNGLGTIYAHLSAINVSKGDRVKTGDVVGLSGNTGYSTGPHLHLGLYVDDGVTIGQYSSSINCKNVSIPLANTEAYLDPAAYLPKI